MKQLKIFIIDDDSVISFLAKKTIDATNVSSKIRDFQEGCEALAFLKEFCDAAEELPDIILLDISMPIMDGWHFLEEYALLMPKMSKKNNLYMFSSSISQIDIERAKNNPLVKDYIFKPLQKERFLEMIEELGETMN
jgi:CheY-like chemotaxis protein